MATFNMDELKKELGVTNDVSMTSAPKSLMERIARVGHTRGRSVEETKALIKNVLAEINRPMSRAEICAALERKNTPHIRNILYDMARDSELIQTIDEEAPALMARYWYALP